MKNLLIWRARNISKHGGIYPPTSAFSATQYQHQYIPLWLLSLYSHLRLLLTGPLRRRFFHDQFHNHQPASPICGGHPLNSTLITASLQCGAVALQNCSFGPPFGVCLCQVSMGSRGLPPAGVGGCGHRPAPRPRSGSAPGCVCTSLQTALPYGMVLLELGNSAGA